MSHGKLRDDKTCLNCGREVIDRFCAHCGQENVEPRQPFLRLITHFFEDFTHYDGQFWKTIRALVFSPGELTKVYLEGRRQQYVPPVRLYIFLSFITFFILSLTFNVGDNQTKAGVGKTQLVDSLLTSNSLTQEDSLLLVKILEKEGVIRDIEESSNTMPAIGIQLKDDSKFLNAYTWEEYLTLKDEEGGWYYTLLQPFAKKYFELKEENLSLNQIAKSFGETFMHTLPKALFFYLPFFALLLWLFHRKRWWFFDHGIFTLHYFSFLLLMMTVMVLVGVLFDLLPQMGWLVWIYRVVAFAGWGYSFMYFFLAHRRFYQTRRRYSLTIGIALFCINLVGITLMTVSLAAISFLLIH